MDVGLVDASWLEKVPATLRPRLQELLDNPGRLKCLSLWSGIVFIQPTTAFIPP
jgi:hypothetical protein